MEQWRHLLTDWYWLYWSQLILLFYVYIWLIRYTCSVSVCFGRAGYIVPAVWCPLWVDRCTMLSLQRMLGCSQCLYSSVWRYHFIHEAETQVWVRHIFDLWVMLRETALKGGLLIIVNVVFFVFFFIHNTGAMFLSYRFCLWTKLTFSRRRSYTQEDTWDFTFLVITVCWRGF